jgi:hypothetical protein
MLVFVVQEVWELLWFSVYISRPDSAQEPKAKARQKKNQELEIPIAEWYARIFEFIKVWLVSD